MKKVLIAVITIAVMSSCSNSGNEPPEKPKSLAEIKLSATVSAGVKSAIDGDKAIIGLQFLRSDVPSGSAPDFIGAVAISGSRAVGGAIKFQPIQDYTATDRTFFASYYPVGDRDIINGVEWDIDGRTDILTAATIDVGTNASHASIPLLSYEHALAQIEVICKAEKSGTGSQERWGNIESIILKNTKSVMTYSYATLTTTTTGADSDVALAAPDYTNNYTSTPISAYDRNDVHAAGMFAAGARSFSLEILTANKGVKVLDIDLGAGNTLQQGRKHAITLTFKEASTPPDPPKPTDEIIVKSTIEPWTFGTPGTGEVD